MDNRTRPRATARLWTWWSKSGKQTPGIGIFTERGLQGHLTVEQAINLSNKLIDLVERLEAQEQAE